jgi:hypothetical protein
VAIYWRFRKWKWKWKWIWRRWISRTRYKI